MCFLRENVFQISNSLPKLSFQTIKLLFLQLLILKGVRHQASGVREAIFNLQL
ncbi:MAG: hypothetical protein ACI9XO_002317 [Paraglaciecola sp.]|jgi:hypothetical protein